MIHIFRKNQRGLMLVIAILTIVAFIFLYNQGPLDDLAETRNAKIYGQTLTQANIDRQVKNYQLTLALGQYDLVSKLGGAGGDQASAVSEFVWNLLVLQHQAKALGVEPTDLQVAERIKAIPVLQTNNQFDPVKYAAFLREQLAPRGFSERQIEEVMRDALRLEKVEAIVGAPVAIGDGEVREAAKILQAVTAAFVRFTAEDAAKGVQISPEEISGYFQRNTASLKTAESRVVRYVKFDLPEGPRPEGRAKIEALQQLADKATKFTDSLAGQSFTQGAASAGLAVHTSPAFDRTGASPGGQDTPGGEANNPPREIFSQIAPAAFLLSTVGKVSDVVQVGDAFYVVELSEWNPSRPLTLAEASPAIESRLRQTKAEEALRISANEKLHALRAAMEAGKSFAEAATELGLKVETLSAVSPMGESVTPEQRRVIAATLSLKDGEISGVESAPWGGFFVLLQSRQELPEAELAAKRAEIQEGLLENKRALLFVEWLRLSRDEAKISVPGQPRS